MEKQTNIVKNVDIMIVQAYALFINEMAVSFDFQQEHYFATNMTKKI